MSKLRTPALRVFTLSAAAVAVFAAQPALAADATSDLSVSAEVTSNCKVTTTAVGFGNIDVTLNQDVNGTGGISVTCTSGTGWTAKAGKGAGAGATVTDRKMTKSGAADLLNYALYTDSGRTIVWGDDGLDTGSSIIGTGSGEAQPITIYGRVPSGQTGTPQGIYADTVVVTVTY